MRAICCNKVGLEWHAAVKAFALLLLDKSWSLELWRLHDAEYPIAQLAPHTVPVTRMTELAQFWPPAPKSKVEVCKTEGESACPAAHMDHPLLAIEDAYGDEMECAGDEDPEADVVDAILDGLLDEVEFAHELEDYEDGGDDGLPGRGKFDAMCTLEGGTISFFANKGDFEARCSHHKTERRRLTRQRTAYVRKPGQPFVGGMPFGLMVAWLARGCGCDSRTVHYDKMKDIGFQERSAARKSALSTPGFAELMSYERSKLDDDELPFEPEHI